jgi:hypothetical protein
MSNNSYNHNNIENEDSQAAAQEDDKYYDENYSVNLSFNGDSDTSNVFFINSTN